MIVMVPWRWPITVLMMEWCYFREIELDSPGHPTSTKPSFSFIPNVKGFLAFYVQVVQSLCLWSKNVISSSPYPPV